MENNKLSSIKSAPVNLVLSGGGFRGAFHLGVLAFLDEHEVKINAISGTSIGALIACSYASGVKPREILDIFESKDFKKILSFNFSLRSIFKVNLNAKVLNKLFLQRNLEDLHTPVYITYSSLNDSQIIYKNNGNIVSQILRSIALFPVFETVDENSNIYMDGGIFDNLPLKPLKKNGHKVLGVNLHPITQTNLKGFFSKLKRMFFLIWHASVKDSIKDSDFYITNEELVKFNIFSQKNNLELFDLGYESARKKFS